MTGAERVNPVNLRESQWYQALPLEERIKLLGRIDEQEVDRAKGDRRMQRWLSQNPFTNSTYCDRRFAVEGITKQQFCALLGESPESLARRCSDPPHWLSALHRAFSRSDFAKIAIAPVENLPDERLTLGFLQLVKPLLNDAIARLETGIQKLSQNYPNFPFITENIKQIVLANLPDRLLGMISQTMVLELNVARLKGQLSGETAKERLVDFIKRLDNPEKAVSLLQEYPVLARQLAIHIHQWIEVNLEFLERLSRDWSEIFHCFSPSSDPGHLIKIQPGAGDSHRGGRSVFILQFSSGFQLVYKPKSLAIDRRLQTLLAWLNEQAHHPPFPLLKILNRGGYGWVEFIAASSCTTTEEVERFYERIGGYLALMYTLEATDFHLENLIAAGENPVLIDLETLFRPERIDPNSPEAMLMANRYIGQSVMGVGLLPQRTGVKGTSAGLDLSGMGAMGDQILPNSTPQLQGIGTDEMRVNRQNSLLAESQNRPYLNGEEVKVWTYQNFIEKGFTNIYRLLIQHREELLSSWIPQFAEDETRVVLRDTRLYGLLLQESFHPDILRDALERDRLFDRLWVDIPNRPYLARAIPLEKKALWRGDVPLFSTHPASRDLFGEGEQIADFFTRSGMERVGDRLLRLSETDLEKQLWFIRTSLTSLAMTSREEKRTKQARDYLVDFEKADNLQSLSERSLKIANQIALRLESLALREQNRAGWIGLGAVGEGYWSIKPLAWDLFEGLPGIALFLGYLGTVLQENRYDRLAKDALNTILLQVELDRNLIRSIGAFDGWGGLIYTLAHLGSLWQRSDLYDRALEWVEILPPLIEKDEHFDIIAGSAGCILALIDLYQCVGDENLKKVAIQCGDRLLQEAREMERGIGWVTIPPRKPLGGFSHGASGIAFALFKLAVFTGKNCYRKAAIAALEYERSLFSTTEGNWRNNREEKDGFSVAWSYGATGIGLARLGAIADFEDAEMSEEIQVALETAIAKGFGSNHSLCNGDLGNLEFLLQEIQQSKSNSRARDDIEKIYLRKATAVLDSIERQGYRCGVPLGVEVLGLMTGLAGMGYELLRFAFPDRVPSLLLLEPPIQSPVSS